MPRKHSLKAEQFWAFYDRLLGVLAGIAAVVVVLLTLAVTMDVLMRYALNMTYVGLFEISEYSLLWMTFLGAPWIMRKDGHVRVDLVLVFLGQKQRERLNLIASVLSAIILLILTIVTARLTFNDWLTGFELSSGILEPPKWPLEIIIPVGFALLTVQLLRMSHDYWKKLCNNSTNKEPSD